MGAPFDGWGVAVNTGDPSYRTQGNDAVAAVEVALRDFGFAVKSLQLYPPTSPVVEGAIQRSYRSLAPLVANSHLTLEITPDSIKVGNSELGGNAPIIEQLAQRIHGRGIARLHVDRRLEPASLHKLSQIIATDPKAIDARGGIAQVVAEQRPRGILAEFLELDRLFGEDEEDSEEEDVWDAIIKGYRRADTDAEDIDWDALASSLDRLQNFVGWLAANLDAIAERTGYENIDVMRFVLDRLTTISSALTSEHINYLVIAVRQAFDQFDPGMLAELLADSIEVEVGEEVADGIAQLELEAAQGDDAAASGRRKIDIGDYIARGLDPEQAERLILETLHTHELSTPRLYGLFNRLTRNRPERGEMTQHIQESIARESSGGAIGADFLANWPRLFEVLNGESPQRFLSAEYETGLQQLLAPADLGDAWPIERVMPRLSEMTPTFIALRKSLMVAHLLREEADVDSYRRLALALERSLGTLLESNEFPTLSKLLEELHAVSGDEERTTTQREIAAGIVERFYTSETIRSLIEASLGLPKHDIKSITAIIRLRGSQSIPLLLDILAGEQDRRFRQRLLRILLQMGNEVGELVIERIDDDRWFVLRNLAMILGEIGNPELVEHLAPMLAHTDARVRREAAASAVRLGGERAAQLLVEALDDEDPATLLTAIHGLGFHEHPEGTRRLRRFLAAPNLRGQSTSLVQTAAIAVGRLGDTESRPALTRLARRPWFFRERRKPAREAAAWALRALDGDGGGKAPDAGMFADVKPGARTLRLRRQL